MKHSFSPFLLAGPVAIALFLASDCPQSSRGSNIVGSVTLGGGELFDLPAAGQSAPHFLGGMTFNDSGTDTGDALTLSMNSIPSVIDWATYDPSGSGPYGAGTQLPHTVKGSNVANFFLETIANPVGGAGDDGVVSATDSSNANVRASNVGFGGNRLGFNVNGTFRLTADIPTGDSVYTLFGADRNSDGDSSYSSVSFDGNNLSMPDIPSNDVDGTAESFALQYAISNDSGSVQQLEIIWNGSAIRVAAVVLQQQVPEPSTSVLALLGIPASARSRRKR